MLLVGAGLLITSFMHLRNLDPGFRADHLLGLNIDLSEVRYPDNARRTAFFDEVVRRVRVLPGCNLSRSRAIYRSPTKATRCRSASKAFPIHRPTNSSM